MIAKDLIAQEFPVLQPDDLIKKAKEFFMDSCICHLPIVSEGKFVGSMPAELILSESDEERKIIDFREDYILANVHEDQHVLNIFEVAAEHELTSIPVCDAEKNFLGIIPLPSLLKFFSTFYSFNEPGGIFTLELGIRDYDLSEIARIVESNNAKILSLYTYFNNDGTKLFITIKVNKLEIRYIRATFERFDYKIVVHQTYDKKLSDLKDRYDLLMKYLDI